MTQSLVVQNVKQQKQENMQMKCRLKKTFKFHVVTKGELVDPLLKDDFTGPEAMFSEHVYVASGKDDEFYDYLDGDIHWDNDHKKWVMVSDDNQLSHLACGDIVLYTAGGIDLDAMGYEFKNCGLLCSNNPNSYLLTKAQFEAIFEVVEG